MIRCAGCSGSVRSTRLPRRARLPRTRPSGARGRVIVSLALAAVGIASRPAGAQEDLLGEPRTIADVRFEGRQRVDDGELRSVMKTRGPSFWPWRDRPALRPDFLRADTLTIRERYLHHGFIDARVGVRLTSMSDSTQVTVTFVI